MNVQRIYISILTIAVAIGAIGCGKDFLDTRIDLSQTEETLNTNYATLTSLANAPYSNLRNEFTMIDNNLFAAVSDEAVQTSPASNVMLFNNGSWNAINNPDNYYAAYYVGIRSANYFLEQSGNYKTFLALNRDTVSAVGKENYQNDVLNLGWYRAEAHILRAWYYFELSKRYGGVPLVTRTLDAKENTLLPKNTYDEIVSFIVSEVDAYKDSLQVNWKTSRFANNDGRLTKGAALALKARALLYAASPLYNTTGNIDKWKQAAAALNDVIVFGQGVGAYGLHSDYRNYFLESNMLNSSETIWAIRYPADNNLERRNYPIATAGGASGVTPSEDLVSAYEYKGTPDPANPYNNRDPRLSMTVVTNGSTWNGRVIDQSQGATDDMRKPNASRTGYYLKKFLADGLNLTTGTTKTHNFPVIRYAGVLLEYAEAMNEAYGPSDYNGYGMNALQAVNMVRARTGVVMPALVTSDKATLRTAIKHERRIELAFENYRYWDLLRWKDATAVLAQPIKGVMVTKDAGQFVYTPVVVENRVFDASRMYFYPFPQTEVIKSKGALVQNNGW
ncbi:putative outer membrane starch-binding protein [Arcticibacter tournemirensis]|uniref:RagB/SusD family nutrient uptake outer membrane protein n=1 Tax=Arcticibacter tournemirensis TaxID=699437 RepID=A0A5M9GUP9_9SPHI|nr:RagB/SusD family nutrient uptake outer membrane protein [Arcticibacter tournemirensis]KAA8477495.1 RagB/SusD family nutrient uptake outer membrane protein [Arcticibacter tournemirensis]TQM51324.1 putative outer membrane starch-binding protein [Arcticibacter tournemirensis]